MGYRSDVYIKCEKNAFEEIRNAYTKHDFAPSKIMKNQNDEFTLIWDSVKWYDHFEEVIEIEKVLRKLNSEHREDNFGDESYDFLAYNFVRIGEDYGDVETKTNDYDFEGFCIIRTVDTDGLGEEIDPSEI